LRHFSLRAINSVASTNLHLVRADDLGHPMIASTPIRPRVEWTTWRRHGRGQCSDNRPTRLAETSGSRGCTPTSASSDGELDQCHAAFAPARLEPRTRYRDEQGWKETHGLIDYNQTLRPHRRLAWSVRPTPDARVSMPGLEQALLRPAAHTLATAQRFRGSRRPAVGTTTPIA
jgi:hypothetical protein